jgi:very-short-patch-repair endonuclease
VRIDTDSAMETVLRLALVDGGLPEPVVNRPIQVGSGVELHGDLVYVEKRVVVEYDGDHHRTEQRQYDLDVDRIWALEASGWRVIRVNRSHLANRASLAVARVRAALAERGRNTPY